ncbi:MAG: S49 family peptidase, partial [Betaproteobacteria bacterium]|nr:S49 family peptidase [Betaproteobacteria bacterium]
MAEENNAQDSRWQKDVIEKLAMSSLKEQKAARRWGIFFKVLTFIYLFVILAYALGWVVKEGKSAVGEHTALIDVAGVIMPGGEVNAESFIDSLADAYDNKGTKGVILRINSPGG